MRLASNGPQAERLRLLLRDGNSAETCPWRGFVALLPPVNNWKRRRSALNLCALGSFLILGLPRPASAEAEPGPHDTDGPAPPTQSSGPEPDTGSAGATKPGEPTVTDSAARTGDAQPGSPEAPPAPAPAQTPAAAPSPSSSKQPQAEPRGQPEGPSPAGVDRASEAERDAHATPAVPTMARVELHVDRPGAWLELRSLMDESDWKRACDAPCGQRVLVDGMEARVQAPGMSPSNVFRVEPGAGTARIKVSSGSSSARTIGVIGLSAGLPVAMAGLSGYGYGRVSNNTALRTAGVVVLAVGAVAALGSLPLLTMGTTTVRDDEGRMIAHGPSTPRF